jgi:phytoene desaturase
MRFHRESRRDRYDAVVVGSGIGGLTAGGLLAKAGLDVLVVERHDRVGGYSHAFRRGGYLFDSAVHLVGGAEPVAFEGGGILHQLLSAVGVRDRVEFERIEPCYAALYPGRELHVPSGLQEFIATHAEAFPGERKGLRQIVQECLNLRQETRRVAELSGPVELMRMRDRFPTLLRYRRATLAQILDHHLDSPQLKSALGTLWPYLGLPPSKLSFLYFAAMLMSYVADGAYYCRGSFQRLADALSHAIRSAGGEVLLRSSVRRILVEDGRARGVVLENGQRIASDIVISNADARQTIHELVGAQAFPPSFLQVLERLRPSLSAFVVYVATDLPIAPETTAHETFFFPTWDHDASHASCQTDRPTWLTVTVPSLVDPRLAPSGEHLLVLTTLVRHDATDWRTAKEPMTAHLVGLAGRVVPGLSEHLRFVEAASPRTMERYTRNSDGAVYGWELSPAQVGPGRLATQLPVEGLYLVGHWTQPGGGIVGVATSGVHTAQAVLGFRRESQLWARVRAGEH